MMALGYTIAGILLFGGLALGAGAVAGLWFGVSAARPEYLERRRRDDDA